MRDGVVLDLRNNLWWNFATNGVAAPVAETAQAQVAAKSVRKAAFFGVTEDEFAMRPPNARGRSGEAGRV